MGCLKAHLNGLFWRIRTFLILFCWTFSALIREATFFVFWILQSTFGWNLNVCFHNVTWSCTITHMMLPLFWTKHIFSVCCSCNSLFPSCFFVLLLWAIRKWTISHKRHTFNRCYVTDQHCNVLHVLFLKCFSSKTHNREESYSQNYSADRVYRAITVWFETASWEPAAT